MARTVAGADPVPELTAAAKPEVTAGDQPAVIDWRIQTTGLLGIRGPLPWLPGIPERIAADPNWGPYLHTRSHFVAQLANQVRFRP